MPSSVFGIARNHCLRFGLDRQLYFGPHPQADLIPVSIGERVLDTKFLVQVVGTRNRNLRLIGSVETPDLMIFCTVPSKVVLGFCVIVRPLKLRIGTFC